MGGRVVLSFLISIENLSLQSCILNNLALKLSPVCPSMYSRYLGTPIEVRAPMVFIRIPVATLQVGPDQTTLGR